MALAKYTFLPWLRQGISNKIVEQDNLGADIPASSSMAKERPELTVKLNLNETELRKNIKLQGPGDVIGINKDAIIREHPKPGTEDFESNCLAYIEFYEEDFPWRYTPAIRKQGEKRLRPWLSLIIAKEEEYTLNSDGAGLPFVNIKSESANKVFFNPGETWAWAHVHINHTIPSGSAQSAMTTLVEDNPDAAYSRLMCPRRLERTDGGVKYHAFLIPTFETGRLAGLGEDPKDIFAQQSSWTQGGVADSTIRPNDYPVYHHWEFKTGEFGDFETLVKILNAQPLGPRFGKREMNIREPGMGLDGASSSETLGLEGALKPPSFTRDNWPAGSGDVTFRTTLESILNISEDIQDTGTSSGVNNPYHNSAAVFYSNKVVDDPIVAPPIYGKWHALVKRINQAGNTKEWVDELNLDPRSRATASLGTQTIRKYQEKFMEAAWQQIGEINEANQKIREAELAKMVNNAIYEKHFYKMSEGKLLMVTSAAQKYILNKNGNRTLEEDLNECKIPNAARSSAFKKVIRPGKKNIRKMYTKFEEENLPVIPIQQSLINNFNVTDTDDLENSLSTAKRKTDPLMAVPTGDVLEAINFFVELQDEPIAQENENVVMDEETKASQIEFSGDFGNFASQIGGLKRWNNINPLPNLGTFHTDLRDMINPLTTIKNMVVPLIMTGDNQIEDVKPLMAYPEIHEPMFSYLQAISQDFIIPNIREIPENTITLLENNQVFIEAFMAGLNHEMSKELLWREYPTDQRGSYFRNFWDDKDSQSSTIDDDNNHDILPMDEWNDSLGEHNQRIINESGSLQNKKDFVVLVIRGDVLKKYPNTVIYTHKAVSQGANNPRRLAGPDLPNGEYSEEVIRTPIFQAELEPDIAMYGFNLTKQEVRGNSQYPAGWFFVMKERPGQINFGLDDSPTIPQNPANIWNDLEWGHLVSQGSNNLDSLNHIYCGTIRASANNPSWGTNSAEMAHILYQMPVIFARHAEEMLP